MKTPTTANLVASIASVVAFSACASALIVMSSATPTQASVAPSHPVASAAAAAPAAPRPDDAGACVPVGENPANVYRCPAIVVAAKRAGPNSVASVSAAMPRDHL